MTVFRGTSAVQRGSSRDGLQRSATLVRRVSLGLLLGWFSGAATAEPVPADMRMTLHIPAQDLARALDQYSHATGVAVLVDSLAEEARLRGMVVRVECDEAAFGPMRAVDPVAFEQVVDNLLLNAFKHSGASEVTIRLSAGDGCWTLQVEDNGHGIAAADQALVFGKFAVATQSSRGTGTGLGLWIVSRLVQAMGGDISLRSGPEQGCAFTVRIPERDDMSTNR